MASLATLLGLAPAGTMSAGQQYQPQMSPEANAFVGAPAPVAAAPKRTGPYGERKGFTNTIGKIADALAVLGGQQPGYLDGIKAQDAEAKKMAEEERVGRTRLAYSNFLANPTEETQQQFIMEAPELYDAYEKSRMVKPTNPGSVSDYQFLVSKLTPMVGEQAAMERAAAIMASRTNQRPVATNQGFMDPQGAVEANAMPFVAPKEFAPPAPSYAPQVLANGNIGSFDQRTGTVQDTGVPAAPRGTGGAAGAKAPQAGLQSQIAVLDEGIADLKRAEALLQKGNITGPVVGALPEFARNVVAPTTITAEEAVGRVAQKELRAILGGQFAAKEGEQLIRRAFNPSQSEAENLLRVQSLRRQIEARRKEIAGQAGGGQRLSPQQASKLPKGTKFIGMDGVERTVR